MLYVIEAIVMIVVCALIGFVAFSNYKKNVETTIGNAEDKARLLRQRSEKDFLKSRKSLSRLRMNLIRRSVNAEQKFNALKEEFSRKKRALIRRLILSRRKKQA